MTFAEDVQFVSKLLDDYAVESYRKGVAAEGPDDAGVPLEMQVGEVDAEGWVEWQVLPSTLSETDITALETEFHVQFPPLFRAYLAARFHLFDQIHSRKYNQLIFMTDTPADKPLAPIRKLFKGWRSLIDAGFIPFAQWGDGWGPMCFDILQRDVNGECPIVWMDHELLIPLGSEKCRQRELVLSVTQPLYASCREFLVLQDNRGARD